jgi:hypothetical protein
MLLRMHFDCLNISDLLGLHFQIDVNTEVRVIHHIGLKNFDSAWILDVVVIHCLGGVWFEELKFNKHCSTFVLFDKKFPI